LRKVKDKISMYPDTALELAREGFKIVEQSEKTK